MLRVALIEDDPYFSKSVEECLRLQPSIFLALVVSSIEDFFKTIRPHLQLDVLLVDIDLPGQSGVEAVPALRRRFPQAEIIMLTQYEDSTVLLQSIHNGASGYLNKDFNILQLPRLLGSLASGAALISPLMARKLIQHFQPNPSATANAGLLSIKELQVLRLFDQGSSYEEAAANLGVTVDGIRYHVKNIYKKLNVDNRSDAVRASKDLL